MLAKKERSSLPNSTGMPVQQKIDFYDKVTIIEITYKMYSITTIHQ